ncbi:RelA/SpoT domain-containing protein [Sulfitobacter sp. S190]|uniref:RelA/SpoT domain-containing protein n=1 Tax=Sulfitobacter sp. S190 TaxID=2867022 RepID=UPI0021A3A610|nr:RelA/SpoT domain-containing protein [Sulfitobacter sp. S190]UWR21970.1 RelA/SpoT domain-containing protein [Sulfitobacter sp. S190]
MVNFARPKYTNSRIRSAGKRIVKDCATSEDNRVLENFRASHAYILNTFQANIRNHSKGIATSVGQRLKRRNTILDKLVREPNMPLSSMHDIAGCRMVFNNVEDLHAVRSSMHSARWKHHLNHDPQKFDYIQKPKSTGYRGIHDVYQYSVNSVGGKPWNGLKLEIQYRTLPQHAWATAVEVADLITSNRIKFDDAQSHYLRYFQLSSEIIARTVEGQKSCCSELSDKKLITEFRTADRRLGLLQTFDNLRGTSDRGINFKKNTILIFRFDLSEEEDALQLRAYENVNKAIEAYDDLEREFGEDADIVLVRGESEANIRDAFRNYFSDARAFVDFIREGLMKLS